MKRMGADNFRNSSARIRPIRQIRGLFPLASLEITLVGALYTTRQPDDPKTTQAHHDKCGFK
jgi:hypothetical protein